MLQRATDGERLAALEVKQGIHDSTLEEIRKELKGIQRNQWLTCGALAAVMFFLNYPQFVTVIAPAVAAIK